MKASFLSIPLLICVSTILAPLVWCQGNGISSMLQRVRQGRLPSSALRFLNPNVPHQPWKLRALETARTSLTIQQNGVMEMTVEHAPIPNVSAEMLEWWFGNVDGQAVNPGDNKVYDKYQIWHPYDHVKFTVPQRSGTAAGPGSTLHITEFFGAKPFRLGGDISSLLQRAAQLLTWIDNKVQVTKLDRTGTTNIAQSMGRTVFFLDHQWQDSPQGAIIRSRMSVGIESSPMAGLMNRMMRQFIMSEEVGKRWLVHCVEEFGNFEHILQPIYEQATGKRKRRQRLEKGLGSQNETLPSSPKAGVSDDQSRRPVDQTPAAPSEAVAGSPSPNSAPTNPPSVPPLTSNPGSAPPPSAPPSASVSPNPPSGSDKPPTLPPSTSPPSDSSAGSIRVRERPQQTRVPFWNNFFRLNPFANFFNRS